jgi:DNA polymerase elongation subunit (family B)
VIKYKRNEATHSENANCCDKFLHNVNRVHMQTPFVEGKYMRFKVKQRCTNNCVEMPTRMFTLEQFDNDFEVVDENQLTTNITMAVACYDIETHSDGYNMSKACKDFIISIGWVIIKNGQYLKICLMYHQNYYTFHNNDFEQQNNNNNNNINNDDTIIVMFNDETQMILAFANLIRLTNPDFVLDYNGDVFDIPFILERLRRTKFTMKRYDLPPLEIVKKPFVTKRFNNKKFDENGKLIDNTTYTHYFNYYIHIDLYKLFSNDPNEKKVENFQLNTISEYYLNENKIDLHWTEMLKMYKDCQFNVIVKYNVQDCILPIKLFLKLKMIDTVYSQCVLYRLCTDDVICNISHLISVVYFYKGLVNTKHNPSTGRDEPDPYFFNKNDLNIISGQRGNMSQLKRKRIPLNKVPADAVNLGAQNQVVKYKGGKVLKPRAGLYEYAFSLDFNSLYLTVMKAECACLTNLFLCDDGNVYLNKNPNAINVKQLCELLEQRTLYKRTRDNQDMSDFLYDLYDQMQNSVKRTANSVYGYYGIFFKTLANHITKIGRKQLHKAITLIESMSNDEELLRTFQLSTITFKVVYGDTDSTFVLPTFDRAELPPEENRRTETLRSIAEFVANKLNSLFVDGYKVAFENLMCRLILLKKKKYSYFNSENKIVYKGWLVKKDMPVFMRLSFKTAIEQILRYDNLNNCLESLINNFTMYYEEFGKSKPLTDYSFSMTYNDNTQSKNKKPNNDDDDNGELSPAKKRRRVITIARHCREILINRGTDFLPGNGDRIPYLLIDVEGKVTEKAYPLRLFDPAKMRISWMKHMGILCTFMNELLEIFGDEYREQIAVCFKTIMRTYMSKQVYDRKEPILVKINVNKNFKTKKTNQNNHNNDDDNNDNDNDDDDDDDNNESDDSENIETSNNTYKFNLYKMKTK